MTVKVVILCDDVEKGVSLHGAVSSVDGLSVRILVANSGHRSLSTYAVAFLRGAATRPIRTLSLVARGRLRLSRRALDDPKLIETIDDDVGIHASSAIYRPALLERFTVGLLNAHIGLLPWYRGRSVLEWSLLNGDDQGVTVFLIDEGIDTGPIVLRRNIEIPRTCRTLNDAKSYFFELDSELYADTLQELVSGTWAPERQDAEAGRRHYVVSALLRNVASDVVRARAEST